MIHRVRILILFACALLLSGPTPGQEFPGEPARVAYEQGFSYLLAGQKDLARQKLEEAIAAGGPYADRARFAVIRLTAQEDDNPEAGPEAIRQLLGAMEDQTLVPGAWLTGVRSLEAAGRHDDALGMALELRLRYPQNMVAPEASVVAAQIYFIRGQYAAALDLALAVLREHQDSLAAQRARWIAARVFASPGPLQNLPRACALHREGLPERYGDVLDFVCGH